MANEDLTTYTEVDPGTVLSITASTVTISDMDRDIDAYLYKDFGVAYFGDFNFNFEAQYDSTSQILSIGGLVGVSNNINDFNAWTDGIASYFYLDTTPTPDELQLKLIRLDTDAEDT